MNTKRNPSEGLQTFRRAKEQNARIYYSMSITNENKNSLLNDEEFEDRRIHNDGVMSDEELDKLLGDAIDDDEPEQAEKPVKDEQPKAELPAPGPAIESPKLSPPEPLTTSYFYELVKRGKYDNEVRELFREFAESSTSQGTAPIERGYLTFKYSKNAKRDEFKIYEQAEEYTNDLRTHDLQWHQVTHPDHKTNKKALHGIFDGIYTRGKFNWDQAYEIAESYYETKSGKIKSLSDNEKVKHLRLPSTWQKELVILRSQKIKDQTWTANASSREEAARIDAINYESIAIREKLEAHANKGMSRMKKIDVYVNVWMAIEISGGNTSNLVGIMGAYELLAGEPINKRTLRDKIKYLQAALK